MPWRTSRSIGLALIVVGSRQEFAPCRAVKYINGMTLDASAANDLASAVAEPLSSASAFYFDPATLAKGKELGLSGMRFYVLGRGGVLGDVHSDVITSAFGYFHPAAVAKLWDSAKEKLAPREAGAIFHECCAEIGRAKLGDVEGLEAFCDAAEAVIAGTNPAGLAPVSYTHLTLPTKIV